MSIEIPLTRDRVAVISEEDYERISQYKWYFSTNGYAVRDSRNFARTSGKVVYMHREIANPKDDEVVDHRNRDKLDNRRGNLRVCTQAENTYNSVKQRRNKSGYLGVHWHKGAGKWSAEVHKQGEKYYLGLFSDKEDAARMYNFWAADLFGEYAFLNEIGGMNPAVVAQG